MTLASIKSFFEKRCKPKQGEAAGNYTPDRVQLTAAALMIEMVRADHESDDREFETMVAALQRCWSIPEEDMGRLIALAAREAHEATGLYEFTSLVNQHYTPEQKTALIYALWEVAFADGELHQYEEHLVRKIADLIYIPHSEFIRTKLAVQERLEKGEPSTDCGDL